MPEWGGGQGHPWPTPRGRPCSGNVPGPRRGVRAAILTTATTVGPHTKSCQRSSGSVSEKKSIGQSQLTTAAICRMLRFEKKQFPYVLLMFGRVHPNTPRGLLEADRGMRYLIATPLQRTFEKIKR